MKPVFKSLLAAATVAVAATGAQAQEAKSLKDLLDQVQQNRVSEARLDNAKLSSNQHVLTSKHYFAKHKQTLKLNKLVVTVYRSNSQTTKLH
jgi:biopolymer transport protein ExbB